MLSAFLAALELINITSPFASLNLGSRAVVKFTGEDQIIDFARRFVYENGIAVFNFGKHKGKPVTQVLKEEPQYYDWMMKGDFALHTKQKLTEILNKTILKK